MYSKPILCLTIVCLILSLSNAKTLVNVNDEHHFELANDNASIFLHTSTSGDLDKREIGRNCVRCKLGVNLCCKPNICVKKTFRPDECMEIKQSKHHKQH